MKLIKNILDYSLAFILIIILFFPLFILYIICTLDTGKNGIFKQIRIGKNGRKFFIYKLRTMKGKYTSSITVPEMQITKWGKILRSYKFDEIPQLINIIKGEMSFVGPRPDVPGYADNLEGEDRIILSVKPGITGPAQLKYKNEEEILSLVANPKEYNDQILWKDKVEINKIYIKNWSLYLDCKYFIQSIFFMKK